MSTTWRPGPFREGRFYRVKKSFAALWDTFAMGELLKYKEMTYSYYDGIHCFVFTDAQDKLRSWDVHEDKPLETWNDFFELV
jgi:hypothetical protein